MNIWNKSGKYQNSKLKLEAKTSKRPNVEKNQIGLEFKM